MSFGYVYIMSNGSDYKIGLTGGAPLKRRGALNTASATQIDLVGYVLCEDMEHLENDLHRRFALKRKNGEWFALNKNDLSMVLDTFKKESINDDMCMFPNFTKITGRDYVAESKASHVKYKARIKAEEAEEARRAVAEELCAVDLIRIQILGIAPLHADVWEQYPDMYQEDWYGPYREDYFKREGVQIWEYNIPEDVVVSLNEMGFQTEKQIVARNKAGFKVKTNSEKYEAEKVNDLNFDEAEKKKYARLDAEARVQYKINKEIEAKNRRDEDLKEGIKASAYLDKDIKRKKVGLGLIYKDYYINYFPLDCDDGRIRELYGKVKTEQVPTVVYLGGVLLFMAIVVGGFISIISLTN